MTPLASENTPVPKRNFYAGSIIVGLSLAITLALVVFLAGFRPAHQSSLAPIDAASSRDRLAYVSSDNHLIVYDPYERTATTLLSEVGDFRLSRDGRVAFIRRDEHDEDIYVFDPSTPDRAPVNVSQNPDADPYLLGWSPDGRYLAFSLY